MGLTKLDYEDQALALYQGIIQNMIILSDSQLI